MSRVILTDIEGTTSSISFVKEVLFPYARRALPAFVRRHGQEPQVRKWLDAAALDIGGVSSDNCIVDILQQWIDEDRKHTALKALQGMIWKSGYEGGAYRAHVYPDAAPQLQAWKDAGHRLAVYSSGSAPAQRLFFAHTEAGDLTGLFSGFFDTEMGGKRESRSYLAIAGALDVDPGEVTFLSDVVEELDAAREAGMETVLVDRREDYPEPRIGEAANGHGRVESFEAITLE
ncbi:acireductone synthase [Alkalisalibacterium limincola]|uniref:Enolase-phosphatase E1 n=1 Tax=Alkalisalibacterium limincola TaxID=2699169 RepID=A0A5C8KZX4_9GAMM|nr:acireductone synthase [Alkalisalibacterium limincola]TXK65701.1 acireductone synthase [Alkalisalibacterium limincola]